MAQGFEPSQSIALQYSPLEQLVQVWQPDAAPASPMHSMSTDRMSFLSGPCAYSFDGTDNVGLDQDHILNQELNEFKSPGTAAPPFEGNEYSQSCDGLWSFDTPPYGEAESPTSPITSDLSQSSIWPSPTRQCFKQEQLAINMDITDPNLLPFGNDYPESDQLLYIYPPDAEPLASCTINGSSPPPPVAPPAAEVRVINIEATEDDVKTFSSAQMGAGRRRKKTPSYACPLRNNGCTATFTARHNLRYHIFAHKGKKPYQCRRCPYAASSPATLKRHQTICKSTAQAIPVC